MSDSTTTNNRPMWANPDSEAGQATVRHGINSGDSQQHHSLSENDDFQNSTLDEPIRETILKDARSVWKKIKVVLLPMKKVSKYFFFDFSSLGLFFFI
jgi:hypothetical protein